MKFLRRSNKAKKIILVISDTHLGAGAIVDGRRNPLEDFHSDKELVDFFDYYSSGDYQNLDVEIIINGDFLDLLAVPYVKYFDDEFWSEKAALDKLEMIIKAHPEVFGAMKKFLGQKNKKIVYLIGNHDSELVFDSLMERFLNEFGQLKDKVTLDRNLTTYIPAKGIYLQHGHEYELAHQFDPNDTTIESSEGEKYFIPSWGSYYVTHVINKYKQERHHVNAVRPIRSFLIHGLIFDTFFTIRFMIANAYYFFMVRFLHYFKLKLGWKKIIEESINQLSLFQDYESLTRDFFKSYPTAKVLIVGHTHEPMLREYSDGTRFINTGTWTRMVSLDLGQPNNESQLTFAKIQINKLDYELDEFDEHVDVDLNKWAPKTELPYEDFR
jgi:UDP-2,3-diacylglucosamine pyrophosphatase LpxH